MTDINNQITTTIFTKGTELNPAGAVEETSELFANALLLNENGKCVYRGDILRYEFRLKNNPDNDARIVYAGIRNAAVVSFKDTKTIKYKIVESEATEQ